MGPLLLFLVNHLGALGVHKMHLPTRETRHPRKSILIARYSFILGVALNTKPGVTTVTSLEYLGPSDRLGLVVAHG